MAAQTNLSRHKHSWHQNRTVFPVPRDGIWLNCAKYQAGLCIFDCPKLVEMESWSSVAVAWMIQVLQVHEESSPSITIVIPGTQIPRWFINQSVGPPIRIEPISYDSDWIGVAFCATIVAHDYDYPTNLIDPEGGFRLRCAFRNKNGAHLHYIPITIKKDLVTVEWVHLCLLYFNREDIDFIRWLKEDIHHIDSFLLDFYVLQDPQGLCLEVKNCGVRVVFKQDLEELNSTVTNNDLLICG